MTFLYRFWKFAGKLLKRFGTGNNLWQIQELSFNIILCEELFYRTLASIQKNECIEADTLVFFMIPVKGIVYSKLYNFLSKRPSIPGPQRGYTLISWALRNPKSSGLPWRPSEWNSSSFSCCYPFFLVNKKL